MSKYQTVANAEEQHLAAMSTTSSTTTTTKKLKKISQKSAMKKSSVSVSVEEEILAETNNASYETTTSNAAEELRQESSSSQKVKKLVKKSSGAAQTIADASEQQTISSMENSNQETSESKKKLKSKKNKKTDTDGRNISVKSSFNKFDALQKRNLIHSPQGEKESQCRLCAKCDRAVYKMEEIKAEKNIYHKNCFRCHECNKQLKVDNYESHEGIPYCTMHFKLLFAPKTVEDTEPEKPRKPELIIRENQPLELPPDVVRASDKPDLGLEDLHQLNVRSRFQVFENGAHQKKVETQVSTDDARNVKRSASILSKMAKLHAHGISDVSLSGENLTTHNEVITDTEDEESGNNSTESDEDNADVGGDDVDLVRSKKRTRERPVGIGKAMDDIKTKFEKGPLMSKDERREERKQEIQNIRSRLFMGKQARIKEMYQQAVADSEHAIVSAGKKPDVEVDGVARNLRERFEKGEAFNNRNSIEANDENCKNDGLHSEADVFESGISKQSRSIFMEIDANVAAGKNQLSPEIPKTKPKQLSTNWPQQQQQQQQIGRNSESEGENQIIKCDYKPDDVKIETSEISQKFKFFETYRPTEKKKKEFRITPPREGVVKMPSPENEGPLEAAIQNDEETHILEKSRTTAKMLDKFRELEQKKSTVAYDKGPRPLKCFTPPPDGGHRVYYSGESDQESDEEEDDGATSDEEEEHDEQTREAMRRAKQMADDDALKEAQAAARAKQLRAKFEKWEANEIQRELHEGQLDIYSQQVSDDSNIESTKSIRERFENMKNADTSTTRPRYQVNRFV